MIQHHDGIVQFGDALDNGEPQSAAMPAGFIQAVKALHGSGTLCLGNAGAFIADGQQYLFAGGGIAAALEADRYRGIGRRVTDGIVDQVAQQDLQQVGMTVDAGGVAGNALQCQGDVFPGGLLRQHFNAVPGDIP